MEREAEDYLTGSSSWLVCFMPCASEMGPRMEQKVAGLIIQRHYLKGEGWVDLSVSKAPAVGSRVHVWEFPKGNLMHSSHWSQGSVVGGRKFLEEVMEIERKELALSHGSMK